ncbi:hypothetical protein KHA96_03815 [Bacillus sp. FJAT-49711]|uniref:hypothetical protein n=1 Tax=Bacillus sp. FJAT-49711 TaxID=2833585 RepID=UPI001BC9C106|nr:hypothetical protein [Bacillus sp. FJAT-49711]MBS4217437.1 hypothetical protein [Bacillus sp. FJAT-49711]
MSSYSTHRLALRLGLVFSLLRSKNPSQLFDSDFLLAGEQQDAGQEGVATGWGAPGSFSFSNIAMLPLSQVLVQSLFLKS